jgi:hypothetical protein
VGSIVACLDAVCVQANPKAYEKSMQPTVLLIANNMTTIKCIPCRGYRRFRSPRSVACTRGFALHDNFS